MRRQVGQLQREEDWGPHVQPALHCLSLGSPTPVQARKAVCDPLRVRGMRIGSTGRDSTAVGRLGVWADACAAGTAWTPDALLIRDNVPLPAFLEALAEHTFPEGSEVQLYDVTFEGGKVRLRLPAGGAWAAPRPRCAPAAPDVGACLGSNLPISCLHRRPSCLCTAPQEAYTVLQLANPNWCAAVLKKAAEIQRVRGCHMACVQGPCAATLHHTRAWPACCDVCKQMGSH